MDNKTFRDEVYKKYEYYKNVNNDDFYNKKQYKKHNSTVIINKVASFLIISIFVSGVVYATSYCIKNIWKEPEEYIYENEKQILQQDIEETITEDEAMDLGLNILKEMNMNIGNVKKNYLNKEPSTNKIEWVIETDNDLEMRINAKTGELYSFSNNKLLNSTNNLNLDKSSAIEIAKKIFTDLNYKNNYEFSYISDLGSGKWQADFCIKYGEIYNPYQCVRITFIAETKNLVMLNVFDYGFENNSYEITEEQAIDIAKNLYGEENIERILAKKDIQKMNTIIYQKENPASIGEYRTDNIVRNVWNVEIVEKQYGFVEKYFIDATTGEVIGGDQVK